MTTQQKSLIQGIILFLIIVGLDIYLSFVFVQFDHIMASIATIMFLTLIPIVLLLPLRYLCQAKKRFSLLNYLMSFAKDIQNIAWFIFSMVQHLFQILLAIITGRLFSGHRGDTDSYTSESNQSAHDQQKSQDETVSEPLDR